MKRSICVLIACVAIACHGQAVNNNASFTVHIEADGKKVTSDYLQIRFAQDYFIDVGYENFIDKHVYAGKDGVYRFSVPVSDNYARINVLGTADHSYRLLSFALAEPGDSIIMKVFLNHDHTVKGIQVEGKGAAKYALSYEAETSFEKDSFVNDMRNPLDSNFSNVLASGEAMITRYLERLYEYPRPVNAEILKIMALDITGAVRHSMIRRILYGKMEQQVTDAVAKDWLAFINRNDGDVPACAHYSKNYIEFLYQKELYKLYYQHTEKLTGAEIFKFNLGFSFGKLYEAIKNNYRGKVREKLLVYCLVNSSGMTLSFNGVDAREYTACLNDALVIVENPLYKEMIRERLNSIAYGAPAYDFSFTDQKGKAVRLKSFAGKVVMLDIWANPCSGCKEFKRNFDKIIYPEIKDRKDIAIVSINANSEKERWIKGIELYSDQRFINVWVGKAGFSHPMINHYKLTGIPKIVLINRHGKIISATISSYNPDELLKMIKEALVQP